MNKRSKMKKLAFFILIFSFNSFSLMKIEGIFGNSGGYGESIYESDVGEPQYSNVGTEGIYVDDNGFIYTGGKAGHLIKISSDGKVVKRYKFPEKFKNYIKYGRICKGKDEIYFFVREWNNYGLLKFNLKEEKFEEISLGEWKAHWYVGHSTATKLNSKGEIFTTLIPKDKNLPVLVTINTKSLEIKEFNVDIPDIQGYGCVDVDNNDNIYLSYTRHQKNYVGKFTPDGKPVKGENWPQILEWYYAIGGKFSIIEDFIWCSGYGGNVSRFKLNGEAYPGNVGSDFISYGGYINQICEKNGKIYLAKTFGILICNFDEDEGVLKVLNFIGGIRPAGIAIDDKGRSCVSIAYDSPVGGEFFFFDKNKPSSTPISNISAGTYFNPTGLAYFNNFFYSPAELNSWQKKKEREPFYIFQEDVRLYRNYIKNTDEYTYRGVKVFKDFLYMVGQDTGKIYKIKLPLPFQPEIEIKNIEEVKFYKDNNLIKFEKPFGIAFDLDENVYITDRNILYKFKIEGERYIFEWAKTETGNIKFKDLRDLIIIDDELFVVDGGNNIVIRIDEEGNYKEHFGEYNVSGNDLYHLNNPTYITGEKGFIYVSDKGNLRVLKIKIK
ncbi:MAG: hypothetical protein ACP5OB_06530 [Candidatus Ratteibacteria bacterium]